MRRILPYLVKHTQHSMLIACRHTYEIGEEWYADVKLHIVYDTKIKFITFGRNYLDFYKQICSQLTRMNNTISLSVNFGGIHDIKYWYELKIEDETDISLQALDIDSILRITIYFVRENIIETFPVFHETSRDLFETIMNGQVDRLNEILQIYYGVKIN